MKTAIITGVTGQDGSYLAEYLLSLGYTVVGLKRRTSIINTSRIDHIFKNKNFKLEYYEMLDSGSIMNVVKKYEPDEFYHLAAQSHVRVSFETPEETVSGIVMGTLKILEVLKNMRPQCKFYYAGSSEMFGDNPASPQNEQTAFSPASPYGCAKVAGFFLTRNYRESYGMFACSGILFNHECVEHNTPILVKYKNGLVDVVRPVDLISLRKKGPNSQTTEIEGVDVWDGEQWTKIKAITATKIDKNNRDHDLLTIQTRGGVINCTSHHNILYKDRKEVRADKVSVGEELLNFQDFPLPDYENSTAVLIELSELFGYLASDGHVGEDSSKIQFTNNDKNLRDRVSFLWEKMFMGNSRESKSKSGFHPYNDVEQLYLTGASSIVPWLREQLYNKDGYKKVPKLIINGSKEVQQAFISAYYCGDGLKTKNHESFVTNSSVLAQGLILIYNNLGKRATTYVEHKNNTMYYRVNVLQNLDNDKGKHLKKNEDEIRKISQAASDFEWVYDLETESSVFAGGVGRLVVHNSPRRGETFVTRKVTLAAARMKHGLQDQLLIGNLHASRDWGYAKEYVECMHALLQHNSPEDIVIGTGETHTVKEWIETVFEYAGMPVEWEGEGVKEVGKCKNTGRVLIRVNSRLYRPHEVNYLLGDITKAEKCIGWKPKVTFEELAKIMYDHDEDQVLLEKK